MSSRAIIIGVLAVCFGATGCGGGVDEPTTLEPPAGQQAAAQQGAVAQTPSPPVTDAGSEEAGQLETKRGGSNLAACFNRLLWCDEECARNSDDNELKWCECKCKQLFCVCNRSCFAPLCPISQ